MAFDFKGQCITIEQMQLPGFRPPEMGTWREIKTKLSACLPTIEWEAQEWGCALYREGGMHLELPQSLEDPVCCFTLRFRTGAGGDPIPVLTRLIKAYGWSLLDMSTGSFLDPDNPSYAGWEGFKGYCNRVISPARQNDTGE
ncbi:MAG: hypothetical protein AMXMBFR13_47990 [Phycisphaerae bacterium]